MTTSLFSQASAVEAARKIVAGGDRLPKHGSPQAVLLASQLSDAAATLRQISRQSLEHQATDEVRAAMGQGT